MESILFLTKDALYRGYLPIYGNKFWKGKTPNLDELAGKGTVFQRYYTGAPSTIMSNMCMFTGKFSHESELDDYIYSHIHYNGDSLWNRAEAEGYECHIIWDEAWKSVFKAEERYYCYGEHTKIHYLKDLRQGVGAHYIHKGFLEPDEARTQYVFNALENEIQIIFTNSKKPVFLWLHIPHVINGRTGYGTDIDVFDSILGITRKYFNDSYIFVSADHGNMNGEKGKLSYGHDVYEPAALIPLITPKIRELCECTDLVSNVDIQKIIFDRSIPDRKIIYCDDAFYGQAHRKLAIYSGNYKYIFNKKDKTEELYDLSTDPHESVNLIQDFIIDKDRNNIRSPLRELYFYPYWDQIEKVRNFMRDEFSRVWRVGPRKTEMISSIKSTIHALGYDRMKQLFHIIRAKKSEG